MRNNITECSLLVSIGICVHKEVADMWKSTPSSGSLVRPKRVDRPVSSLPGEVSPSEDAGGDRSR